MKKTPGLIFLLLVCASVVLAQQSSDWINYSSTEGRYAILLPAQPKLSTQEASTADGQKFTQYLAAAGDGTGYYMVGYFDHVPGTTFSFERARDGMVEKVKGTLLSDKTSTLGSYEGRELKVSTKAAETDFIILARLWNTEERVYVLQYLFPKSLDSEANDTKAAKYFDSFQVLKN